MPRYQIELLWRCICPAKQINKGLSRHCSNCGRPKGPEMEEFFPDDISIRAALHGHQQELAKAGPDFDCKYCGALNSAMNKCCNECGADKETGAKPWMAQEQTATLNVETGYQTRSETRKVSVGLEVATAQQRVDFEVSQQSFRTTETVFTGRGVKIPFKKRSLVPYFIASGVILFGLLMWLIFRTHEADVNVTATHWDRQVFIDRWQVFHREGFDTDTNAFNIVDLGERYERTDQINPHDCNCTDTPEKCVTTPVTCTKNKNGTADCTGGDRSCTPASHHCDTCYDDKKIYAEYYSWDVWDWLYNRTVAHSCDEPASVCNSPIWPTDAELVPSMLSPGEKERNHREEHYTVVMSEKDGSTHDFHPQSEREFAAHPMKSTAHIRYGIAHGVEILP
jgi:hypothetical protein